MDEKNKCEPLRSRGGEKGGGGSDLSGLTTKPVDQYLCMYVFIFSYISLNKDLQFRFRKKNNSLTFVKLLKILELSNFWDKKLISRRAVDAKDATIDR